MSTPTEIQVKRGDTADLFDGNHSLLDAEIAFSRNTTLKGGPQDGLEVRENSLYVGNEEEIAGFGSFSNSKDLLSILHYYGVELKKLRASAELDAKIRRNVDYKFITYFYNRGVISGAELFFVTGSRNLYVSPGTYFGGGKIFSLPELSVTIPAATVTSGAEKKKYVFLSYTDLSSNNSSSTPTSARLLITDENFEPTHSWVSFPQQVTPSSNLDVSSSIDGGNYKLLNYYKDRQYNYVLSKNIDTMSNVILLGSYVQTGTDTGSSVNTSTKNTMVDLTRENKGVYGKFEPYLPYRLVNMNTTPINLPQSYNSYNVITTILSYKGSESNLGGVSSAYSGVDAGYIYYNGLCDFVKVAVGSVDLGV